MAASPQHVQQGRGKSVPCPWTKGEKRQPIGNSDHCTGWCQDDVLPLQVAEDISSMSCLDTQGFEGEPRAGMCWWSGTHHWHGERQTTLWQESPPGHSYVLACMDLLLAKLHF